GNGPRGGYVRALAPSPPNLDSLRLEPMDVQKEFDRELAASAAGTAPDHRHALLVAAAPLGSQLAPDLAAEGPSKWSVVDDDRLMPHNLARHALLSGDVGLPKAAALARHLGDLLGEPATTIITDITTPPEDVRQQLDDALARAEIVIDASASVAAAR